MSTQHERDGGSGYDNRGARFYDGDRGVFLGVDPMMDSYAAWSSYNYVLGNPVAYLDPNGKSAINADAIERDKAQVSVNGVFMAMLSFQIDNGSDPDNWT